MIPPRYRAAGLPHRSAAPNPAVVGLDDLLELFFGELSDEACAQIADFLMQLALCFENTHLSQIRQHHDAMRPEPTYNPNQLELFDPF